MNTTPNPPFKITVEHWDEKLTIELDRSDISFDEYVEMLRKLSSAIFTTGTHVKDFFEGVR